MAAATATYPLWSPQMTTAMTETAATELGKHLRFVRHARAMTLRDVAKRSGLSPQYVQNLERGERMSASEDAYHALGQGYGLDQDIMDDLLMRARVLSALERRGLDAEQRTFVWRGVESRLHEIGVPLRVDVAKLVAELL